jgi:hypothetical protein
MEDVSISYARLGMVPAEVVVTAGEKQATS